MHFKLMTHENCIISFYDMSGKQKITVIMNENCCQLGGTDMTESSCSTVTLLIQNKLHEAMNVKTILET